MSQRLTLVFATLASLSSGTNYSFSSWAPQLAARLHLNSKQTNIVGAAGNAGVYLSGPLLGILVDKRGPRIALLIAAISLFVGCELLPRFTLFAELTSLPTDLALRAIYAGGEEGLYADWGVGGLALAELFTGGFRRFFSLHQAQSSTPPGIGSSAGLSGAVNGVSKSFSSKKRGSALATVVAGFGLSAFLYSTLSHLITSADPTSSFLLLLAFGTGLSTLLGAVFVRPVLHPPPPSRAGYLAVDDFDASPLSRSTSPLRQEEGESYFAEEAVGDDARRRELSKERAAESLDINGRELLSHSDFWLMFAYLGLCSGVGLMCESHLGAVLATLLASGLTGIGVAVFQRC